MCRIPQTGRAPAFRLLFSLSLFAGALCAGAQSLPRVAVQLLTNREAALTLSVSNGPRHRVDASSNYRESGNIQTNAVSFKQILGAQPGIEVRLRRWY